MENVARCAERTQLFLDIPGVVAMVDGDKIVTQSPGEHLEQNRDYNGWTRDVNRNLVLVWDNFGKIVDAAVNMPGSFHDSKSTLWSNMYNHMKLCTFSMVLSEVLIVDAMSLIAAARLQAAFFCPSFSFSRP